MTSETRGAHDPTQLDQRIRGLLLNTLASSPWARQMFARAGALQKEFFRYMLSPEVGNHEANAAYETVLWQLADMMHMQVREGGQHLQELRDAPSIIVASNHLGIAKVGCIDNRDRGFNVPTDELGAFPIGMLPGFAVSQFHAGKTQLDIRGEAGGDFATIYGKLDGIVIGRSQTTGRTETLVSEVRDIADKGERNVFLLFPEGGTSGKRNNGGPYDLDTFRAGTFVVASQTSIPILPVCQYFDPARGLDLLVLPPLYLGEADLPHVGAIKDATQQAMQARLSAMVEVSALP